MYFIFFNRNGQEKASCGREEETNDHCSRLITLHSYFMLNISFNYIYNIRLPLLIFPILFKTFTKRTHAALNNLCIITNHAFEYQISYFSYFYRSLDLQYHWNFDSLIILQHLYTVHKYMNRIRAISCIQNFNVFAYRTNRLYYKTYADIFIM
jgi:hypothetical protein